MEEIPRAIEQEIEARARESGADTGQFRDKVIGMFEKTNPELAVSDRWLAAIEAADPSSSLDTPDLWIDDGKGGERPNPPGFVARILAEHHFATFRDTGETLVYVDGKYAEGAPAAVAEWVESMFLKEGKTSSTRFRMEILGSVGSRTYVDRAAVNPQGKLCVANGILDLDTMTIASHTPDIVFTVKLPVAFDPAATCPRFEALAEQVLPDLRVRELLREVFAYVLDVRLAYQVAVVGFGDGSNGKSVTFGALADLLGPDLVSTIPLQDLRSKFSGGALFGKQLNLATELPRQRFDDTAMFKSLTGGDLVSGERKFRDPFSYRPTARYVFTSNELPPTGDYSEGFRRRWLLIEFPVFIPPEDRDPRLPEVLRGELAGILNWSLAGLGRLRERGRFAPPDTDIGATWERLSDPLAAFLTSHVERIAGPTAIDFSIAKKAMTEEFNGWAGEEGVDTQRQSDVSARIPQLLPGIHETSIRVGGKRVRAWSGIRWKVLSDDATEWTAGTPGTSRYLAHGTLDAIGTMSAGLSQPTRTGRTARTGFDREPSP